jgi:hypothetical protein
MTQTVPLGRQRLLNLIEFLRTFKPSQFDYRSFVSAYEEKDDGAECDTICCAVGWLPAIDPVNWSWNHRTVFYQGSCANIISHLMDYFQLDETDIEYIFFPKDDSDDEAINPLPYDASLDTVINHLQRYADNPSHWPG